MDRPVILSALSPDHRWESGLAPSEVYHGLQSLLGWDAQLKTLGAYLASHGVPRFVTAAPELFFTPASRQTVGRAVGLSAADIARAVHIRVGTARYTRIFRTIPNFLATADTAWPEILAPGQHPLRAHNVAPHAIGDVLDLADGAASLFRPDGSEIPCRPVPGGLILADLQAAPPISHAALEPGDFRGLEIHSVSEFTPESWSDNLRPSLSPRRIALAYNARPEVPRPLILLPWNLANPAHAAPGLALKYLRATSGTEHAGYVMLLPFNATAPMKDQLGPLVLDLRRRVEAMASQTEEFSAADPAQLSLLVARVVDLHGLEVWRRLRAVAWIDGLDPEARYTAARLQVCGVPTLTLRAAGYACGPGELPVIDEPGTIEVNNEFGRLFYRTGNVSARNIERVIAATSGAQIVVGRAKIETGPQQNRDFLEFVLGLNK